MKISADDEGQFMEMDVEAEFANLLKPSDIPYVMQIILDILNGPSAKGLLLEGLSFFQVELARIHLRFRYATKIEDIKLLDAETKNVLPTKQSQFVFYVFAVIDQKFTLGKVPFPPDFRSFISFPS